MDSMSWLAVWVCLRRAAASRGSAAAPWLLSGSLRLRSSPRSPADASRNAARANGATGAPAGRRTGRSAANAARASQRRISRTANLGGSALTANADRIKALPSRADAHVRSAAPAPAPNAGSGATGLASGEFPVDDGHFDELARRLAAHTSRRGLVGAAVAAVLLQTGPDDAAGKKKGKKGNKAKNKKKKKKKGPSPCANLAQGCAEHGDCCGELACDGNDGTCC